MKELIDRYVRSLKERDDHPEHPVIHPAKMARSII